MPYCGYMYTEGTLSIMPYCGSIMPYCKYMCEVNTLPTMSDCRNNNCEVKVDIFHAGKCRKMPPMSTMA